MDDDTRVHLELLAARVAILEARSRRHLAMIEGLSELVKRIVALFERARG